MKRADTCHSGGGCATPWLDDSVPWAENPVMAGKKPSSEARKERLSKALKANIAKRKAQAKTRQQAQAVPEAASEEDGCPN